MGRESNKRASLFGHVDKDVEEFSGDYDGSAPPVGLVMAGHDTYIMGPKVVMLDGFVVDLLKVDTSAQTFHLKLLINMDWEDDGTIEPEVKAKRILGRSTAAPEQNRRVASERDEHFPPGTNNSMAISSYRTGKYVLRMGLREDPLGSTWNPEVVLVNAIADEDPIEAGSKLHSVQMLAGRPVISRSVLYQPECRCEFDFSNYPFDETDLVVKFSSNKWTSEQVQFIWTNRLRSSQNQRPTQRRESSFLRRSVDKNAIGGVGLSEFEIIKLRVETDEKDVNSMQRYDNAEGVFSQARLIIRVRRDPYSYLLRVASVSELLMFLEVLSFVTEPEDLSARFSISGTNFLAMVSLYGPMADALPKVSVVTRVDKWHLQNFFLLFVSNVENLLAYMLSTVLSERALNRIENVMAMVYLYAVINNLIWFIKPLKERSEFNLATMWFEGKYELYLEKFDSFVGKLMWWRKKKKEEDPNSRKIRVSFGFGEVGDTAKQD